MLNFTKKLSEIMRNYLKMTISYKYCNSFVKLYGGKNGSHNMTMLYPNLCYNEVCYKGTALFLISLCLTSLYPVCSVVNSNKHSMAFIVCMD